MYNADEISDNNEGFDENTEKWGLGDMDCRLFNEDMWKEWRIKENEDKIKENEDKIKENEKMIKENNRKIWDLGNLEFWSTDDDDFENVLDTYLDEIKTDQASGEASDADSLCVNVGTIEELWEDDDESVDEEKNAKYEKIVDDYLSGVQTVCCWD
jgi:hypothetical protein